MNTDYNLKQATILVIKSTTISLKTLISTLNYLVRNKVQKIDANTQKGKQDLEKFVAKNERYQNVELADIDKKLFDKIMKRNNIAYAFDMDTEKNLIIVKLGATPEKVQDAIKQYTTIHEKEIERKERKEQMKIFRKNKNAEKNSETKDMDYNKNNPYARSNF